jgi:hypothetical protein
MTDRIRLSMPITTVVDGANFTVDVVCEDRASDAGSTPGALDFRVDDVTDRSTPVQVQDWTSVTPGESAAIALSSACSALLTATNQFELKQITVTADRGQTFECSSQATWKVFNKNTA